MSEWPLIFLTNPTPLNQRVPGSSPGAPTKLFKDIAELKREQTARVCDTGWSQGGATFEVAFTGCSMSKYLSARDDRLVRTNCRRCLKAD